MERNTRHGIFLSYARQDGEVFATRLRELLKERAEDIRILQDRLLLEGGRGWLQQIRDAIDSVSFLVLVMTPAAAVSGEVRAEWDYARACGVCVYPVKGAPDADLRFERMPEWMSKVHFFDIDKEWESFVGHLRAPCQAPRAVFTARDAPATFVMRPVEFDQAKTVLLHSRKKQPADATVVLSGPGGFGKTTLALAICGDNEIRRHFDDGVLWIDLGPHPDSLSALATLYTALTGERPAFAGEEDAIMQVAQKLDRRSCLVAIDDVWDATHLKPLVRATKGCARLVTTQISQVADWDFGELPRVAVDVMTPAESVQLLGFSLPNVDQGALKKLARQLGEWPLFLDIAGATMRRRLARGEAAPAALEHTLRSLNTRGLNALKKQTAESRHRTIGAALSLPLELLSRENRRRLKELSIFPEGLEIPLSAAGMLWGLEDPMDTEEVAEELGGFSLMQLDLGQPSIRMHDVIRRWLGEQVKNPARLHNRLVDGWRNWLDLPDSYAWRWLPWHLARAGRQVELYKLAREEQFLALQQERLREQPYAPLTTIQTAMEYAAAKPDAARLAEMVLRHADHFEKLSQQSPMDALRAGETARAFSLAGGFEIERRILWLLLLAWEAKQCKRAADLRTALERLGESRPFPRIRARQSRLAADLMVEALEPGSELFLELRNQSLNWCGLLDLSLALARRGELLALAPSVAAQIAPLLERARALMQIGSQQALRGQSGLASDTFARAIEAVEASRWQDPDAFDDDDDNSGFGSWGWHGRDEVLGAIAAAQVKAGDLATALETVAGISQFETDRVLAAIAREQAGRGEWEAARAILKRIDSVDERVRTLLTLAVAQKEAGLREAGSEALEAAIAAARKSKQLKRYRTEIALAKGRMGAPEQARKTIRSLKPAEDGKLQSAMAAADLRESAERSVDALRTTARDRMTAGLYLEARANLGSAVQIALGDSEDVELSRTLQEIARMQVEAGDAESARATYAKAILESRGYRRDFESNFRQSGEALAGVALAYAQKGRFGAAVRRLKDVDSWIRASTLVKVAEAQARQGDWKGALKAALQIEHEYRRSQALVGVATVLFRKGESTVAAEILRAAYKESFEIAKFSIRALALLQVGAAFIRCNEKKAGLLVLLEAAWHASSIEPGAGSDHPDDGQEILRDIAVEQARAGDRDAAMATLKLIYHQDLYAEAAREVGSPVKPAVDVAPGADIAHRVPAIAGEGLKEEALQSAWLRASAYRFCGRLAQQFPDCAGAIEKAVLAAARR